MTDGWDDARRAPAKKDTRTWCRGKVGVEHEPEIAVGRDWPATPRCHWYSQWGLRNGRRDWHFGYMCRHIERCRVCGKVSSHFLEPKQCPEITPQPTRAEELNCSRCTRPYADHGDNNDGGACRAFYWNGMNQG